MARIPEDFVQDLLNRLDIVEVVERYLPLKKAGQNYMACCPFHKEKSPSFTVSPTKQFYHCFGCGVHGSAIGFVMEYEGLGFQDTVEKLAESVGMKVPRGEGGTPVRRPAKDVSLVELNARALQFYRQCLKDSPRAIDYLKRRGLTGQVAARFGLGYAPDNWHPLAQVFGDYATNPALKEVGLVIDHEDSGRRYDRFRDRIIFPILDSKHNVIGFGGRVIDQGDPKYLNSPETPLFHKGLELYGLPQARQAVRTKGRVLVVEGYMDVVALAQLGVEYAVATLGTACTPDHVRKLLRLADEVVFCFDGDNAGRRAAWRALENSVGQVVDGKKLSFLFLPPEHDPDSYIRAHGAEAFEALVADAGLGMAAFLTRELASQVDLASEEGRAKLLHLAKPLVEQIQAPALGTLVRKRLAELVELETNEVARLTGASSRASGPVSGGERGGGRRWSLDPQPSVKPAADLGRELLQLLLVAPHLALEVPQSALPHDSDNPRLQAIVRVVDFVVEQIVPPLGVHMLEALRDSEYHGLLSEALRLGEEHYGRSSEEEIRQAWRDGLTRFLKSLEQAEAAARLAELQTKRPSQMSEAEKAEFLRLTGLR
ncbi:DNA primase [Chitinimonas lacunae]|uniref:DNA primase n=1 Tax=Chitinimonas lacunae TaxID=1963018 RepID=A0ABV8MQV1_9NEIS